MGKKHVFWSSDNRLYQDDVLFPGEDNLEIRSDMGFLCIIHQRIILLHDPQRGQKSLRLDATMPRQMKLKELKLDLYTILTHFQLRRR